MTACRSFAFPSPTASSSRPSASARSVSTGRTSGTTARSTASSAAARCGSRRRREACSPSRSPGPRSSICSGCSGISPPSRSSLRGLGDPVLARAAAELAGFRPPLVPDPFEALVTSITAQQVSLHSAFAIRSRLIERYGEPAEHAIAFPTQERIAEVSEDDLFALGFSHRKAEYVVGLARAGVDYEELAELPDDEVKERLTAAARARRVDAPTGTSRGTSDARTPGRPATSACARPSPTSTLSQATSASSAVASTRSRTSPATTSCSSSERHDDPQSRQRRPRPSAGALGRVRGRGARAAHASAPTRSPTSSATSRTMSRSSPRRTASRSASLWPGAATSASATSARLRAAGVPARRGSPAS